MLEVTNSSFRFCLNPVNELKVEEELRQKRAGESRKKQRSSMQAIIPVVEDQDAVSKVSEVKRKKRKQIRISFLVISYWCQNNLKPCIGFQLNFVFSLAK